MIVGEPKGGKMGKGAGDLVGGEYYASTLHTSMKIGQGKPPKLFLKKTVERRGGG
jgi:hypothetical protein